MEVKLKLNLNIRKVFTILILTLLLIISSTNYYGIKGIDNLAYVVAIGLDVGDEENLKLSLQISVPNSDDSSSGSSSQSSSVVVNSMDCPSINTGLTLFNSYLGKEVNLSHCKVLVISEELAYRGIAEYLYTLINDVQFRSDSNIIISKCDAKSYLEYSAPVLDKVSARYYKIAPISSEYTGYTESITCNEFLSNITYSSSEPVAILGSINTPQTQEIKSEVSNKDVYYTAGQTPISGENGVENMGLAVFEDDKLIGELNGLESICHLIISNKLQNAQIRIPSPIENLDYIDLYIELDKSTKSSVFLTNSTPYITSEIFITAKMQSMNRDINLVDDEVVAKIEKASEEFLEEKIYNYLYKTSKELHVDIDNFGLYSLKYFWSQDDWKSYNWLHHYKDAFFNVNVELNLRSSYLLVDTLEGE